MLRINLIQCLILLCLFYYFIIVASIGIHSFVLPFWFLISMQFFCVFCFMLMTNYLSMDQTN